MTVFYPKQLSKNHCKMLFDESGIDPTVAQERGYMTVRSGAGLLDFRKYQRRPGLIIPVRSPSGATSRRLRPDRPRKGKDGKPRKYEQPAETPNMLDVHPRNVEALGDASTDLWVTEGEKKADALTSRGLCAVALFGVWGWCVTGTKGRELLACWEHIALKGRRVYVVFDADIMEKENVQLALERLVAALEGRGAEVMVVYLPGPEKGVDDYLVVGHSVNELKMLARTFEPSDIGRIRLCRDEKLRAALEDLEDRFWAEEWKGQGGHSDRDIALKLIEAAERTGKVVTDGVRVVMSHGTLALESKVSSRTLCKALKRLEERGLLYRDNEGRKSDKAGAFVLRASVKYYEGKQGPGGKVAPTLQEYDPGTLHLRAPRLRWSSPKYTPRRGVIRGTREVRQGPLPERRPAIKRLGKVRGAVLDALDSAGGSATLPEIAAILHRKRPRDIRRRILPMLEDAGIIVVVDDVVSLTAGWLEALDVQRKLGKEIEAEEVARGRLERKRKAFHGRHRVKPDPVPSEKEMDEYRESRPARRRQAIASAIARLFEAEPEQRGRRAGQITCRLPCYMPAGFPWWPKGPVTEAEVEAILDGEAGPVATDALPPEPEPPPAPHPLDCGCLDCSIPTPKYARPYRGAA
jgi:hypothetical protein